MLKANDISQRYYIFEVPENTLGSKFLSSIRCRFTRGDPALKECY